MLNISQNLKHPQIFVPFISICIHLDENASFLGELHVEMSWRDLRDPLGNDVARLWGSESESAGSAYRFVIFKFSKEEIRSK